MGSFTDITGNKDIPGVLLKIGGLHCAGTMAQLSTTTNSLIKENIESLLLFLSKAGVNLDSKLLSAARLGGDKVAVSALLGAGADKNAASRYSALYIAVSEGHGAVVKALLRVYPEAMTVEAAG